jgi:ABC-2 type transport system ATP-binding protein
MNEEGTTIVLTTHYLEEAEQLCRTVAIINKGEIQLQDSMENLLNSSKDEKLEDIYLAIIDSKEVEKSELL